MMALRDLLINPTIDSADNRQLLAWLTGLNKAQLISRDNEQLNEKGYSRYLDYVKRLKSGEPLSYIIGFKEFYSRNFKVTPDTLIPRPETELLVDEVLKHAGQNARILDLGTGSGVVAISAKLERPDLIVMATDKYQATLAVARENAYNLGAMIEFRAGDWYQAVGDNTHQFDIIVSNPPYISADDHHLDNLGAEPLYALTDFANGLNCILTIVSSAKKYLSNSGWLMVEHGYDQGPLVSEIFVSAGLKQVTTLQDYAGLDRITLGTHRL